MKARIVIGAAAVLALAVAGNAQVIIGPAGWSPYAGPWTHQWDFESGLQGWTITGNGSHYNAGGSGPSLPDGAPSGYGGNSLYLPDNSYARLSLSSLGLSNIGANGTQTSGRKGFILQADVWVPNLLPLTGFPNGYPGNALQLTGIGAEGTRVAIYTEGKATNEGLKARDYAWDNTDRNRSNSLVEKVAPGGSGAANAPYEEWWDAVVTLQIDYGFSHSGSWTAWGYIPFYNRNGAPGWYAMSSGNYAVHPDGSTVSFLQLGGMFSWTQAQFDNVKFVPEPATIGLLALGGLLVMRRRR